MSKEECNEVGNIYCTKEECIERLGSVQGEGNEMF